jgi:hypothetical protein
VNVQRPRKKDSGVWSWVWGFKLQPVVIECVKCLQGGGPPNGTNCAYRLFYNERPSQSIQKSQLTLSLGWLITNTQLKDEGII